MRSSGGWPRSGSRASCRWLRCSTASARAPSRASPNTSTTCSASRASPRDSRSPTASARATPTGTSPSSTRCSVCVAAAVWRFIATWQIWVLVFTALIIAAAILPAARFGERWGVPRGLVVLAVYVAVAGVFSLMGRLLWPALSEQWRQFMEQLPKLIENVRGWLGDVDYWLGQWGASLPTPKADGVQGVANILLGNAMRLTTGAVGAVFEVLAVLVVAAYLVIDAREVGHTLLTLLPREHRPTATRLAPAVLNRIGGYVRGQLVSSFFVGVLIAIALSIIGVKYALLIGALAAVLNIVPFVGATVATVLATLSALNDGIVRAAITVPVM